MIIHLFFSIRFIYFNDIFIKLYDFKLYFQKKILFLQNSFIFYIQFIHFIDI